MRLQRGLACEEHPRRGGRATIAPARVYSCKRAVGESRHNPADHVALTGHAGLQVVSARSFPGAIPSSATSGGRHAFSAIALRRGGHVVGDRLALDHVPLAANRGFMKTPSRGSHVWDV